jgi:hypothetical protein
VLVPSKRKKQQTLADAVRLLDAAVTGRDTGSAGMQWECRESSGKRKSIARASSSSSSNGERRWCVA